MNKQNRVYTYSGILFRLSKDENLTHATALINLENIWLSEINQAQNDQSCLILSIQNTQNKKIHRENRINVIRSCGHGRIGSYCLMGTELILWWWKVLKVDVCDGCSTLFTENHWIVWLDMVKMPNLMLYIFNHSEKKKTIRTTSENRLHKMMWRPVGQKQKIYYLYNWNPIWRWIYVWKIFEEVEFEIFLNLAEIRSQ